MMIVIMFLMQWNCADNLILDQFWFCIATLNDNVSDFKKGTYSIFYSFYDISDGKLIVVIFFKVIIVKAVLYPEI